MGKAASPPRCYDFTSVRPKKGDDSPRTPPGRRVPPRRRKATARTPRVVTSTMQSYIDSLPRGERGKAKRTMEVWISKEADPLDEHYPRADVLAQSAVFGRGISRF